MSNKKICLLCDKAKPVGKFKNGESVCRECLIQTHKKVAKKRRGK